MLSITSEPDNGPEGTRRTDAPVLASEQSW
jgi:hypothetical protein